MTGRKVTTMKEQIDFEHTAMVLGQTDLDGWMNAPCSIAGTHKVRAPWWIKEEAKRHAEQR